MANTAVHGSKYLGYNSLLPMLNRATAKCTAIPTFAALDNDFFRQKLHYGPIEILVGVLRGRTTTSQEQSGIRQSMVDVLQQVEHSWWVTTPYGFASITLAFAVHVTNIDCIRGTKRCIHVRSYASAKQALYLLDTLLFTGV